MIYRRWHAATPTPPRICTAQSSSSRLWLGPAAKSILERTIVGESEGIRAINSLNFRRDKGRGSVAVGQLDRTQGQAIEKSSHVYAAAARARPRMPRRVHYKRGTRLGVSSPPYQQTTHSLTTIMATLVDILLCILAIILPPLPVLIKRGCGINLLINILLCIFGLWIGGTPHTPSHTSFFDHCRVRSFTVAFGLTFVLFNWKVSSTLSTSFA